MTIFDIIRVFRGANRYAYFVVEVAGVVVYRIWGLADLKAVA